MNHRVLLRATALACVSLGLMGFEPGSARYHPPKTDLDPPKLARTVDKPFETVWGAMIANATGSGFVLTDRDEESGTLTFRFGDLAPVRYVTGGHYRQSDPTPYHKSPSRYGPVVNFRGDYVEFATERRGGRLTGTARVTLTRLDPERTALEVHAGYEYVLGENRWRFESGDCATALVPDAHPDTPLERILCPTNKAEEGVLELAGAD